MLAGGAGTRVEGEDKGLIEWRGKALVEHVYQRIARQADNVLISCNRNRERYARIGELSAADTRGGFQGPLAGLEAAIPTLSGEFVLIVPCDTPLLPSDLASRLARTLLSSPQAAVCYATSGGDGHYLCALLRQSCLDSLPGFLDAGGRAVRKWYAQIGFVSAAFDDEADNFLNLNQLPDIRHEKARDQD